MAEYGKWLGTSSYANICCDVAWAAKLGIFATALLCRVVELTDMEGTRTYLRKSRPTRCLYVNLR